MSLTIVGAADLSGLACARVLHEHGIAAATYGLEASPAIRRQSVSLGIETVLGDYEAAVFPRAAASAEESAMGLESYFAADSHRALVEFLTSMSMPAKSNRTQQHAVSNR